MKVFLWIYFMGRIFKLSVFVFLFLSFCGCNDEGHIFFDTEHKVSPPDELAGVLSWAYSPINSDTGFFPANTQFTFHLKFEDDGLVLFYRNKEEIMRGKLMQSDYGPIYIKTNGFKYSIDNRGKYFYIESFPFYGSNYFFKADNTTWKPDLDYIEPFTGYYVCHWYNYIYNVAYGCPISYREFNCIDRSDEYTPLIQFDNPSKIRFFPPDFRTFDYYTFTGDSITKVERDNDPHTTDITNWYYYAVKSIE